MNKMQLKKDDADVFKKIELEELEEIVCTNMDFLDESYVLIGIDTDGMIFDKSNIDDLFKIINSKNIRQMYYINGNEQEIKIECVDNSQLLLLNIG